MGVAVIAIVGVYSGGVRLGTTLAPSREDAVAPRDAGPPPLPGALGPDSTTTTAAEQRLPDRYEPQRPPAPRPGTTVPAPDPTTTDPADPTDPSTTDPGDDPPAADYVAVWPYATWDEARDHAQRSDPAFLDPATTAADFARDVVGVDVTAATVVRTTATSAVVQVRSAGGRTLVELARPASRATPADRLPWGVVRADGAATLDAPRAASGATVRVSVGAAGVPTTVAVFDRWTWRGVSTAAAGAAEVRLDAGAAARALVVALVGDPRAPSSFTVRPLEVAAGAGAPVAAPPADPVVAAGELLAAVRAGDVRATWARLDVGARAVAVDWRGLAARMTDLRAFLEQLGSGPLTASVVSTPAGSVAVVAGSTADSVGAVAFRVVDGAARLAAIEAHPAVWTEDDTGLVVGGPPRAEAVLIDGEVATAVPDGDALRVATAGLDPGRHVVVAVFVVDRRPVVAAHDLRVMTASITQPGG